MVKFSSETSYELRFTVRDYALRKAMELPDLIQKKSGCSFCCYRRVCWNEVCSFRHRVHYCHHCVMFRGEEEFHNKVHTERVPSWVWDPERVQFAYQSLPYWFCPDAEITGADVLSDVPRHLRPPVFPRDQFQCFPASGVSSNLRVMTQGDYSSS